MPPFKDDITIAREALLQPIERIGEKLGIPTDALFRYGHHKAKIGADFIASVQDRPDGNLVLVTAITPTPAGEGKTTTTIGLGDALIRIGQRTAVCLREPSLGPCFGMKGGATGGGHAQVVPMEDINLHFTGDFHAITAANNLLSAMIDNHIYWGNALDIDPERVTWRRVMDMNDRSLRSIVFPPGQEPRDAVPRSGFDITVASEVMAVFCLATDLPDLRTRLGNIIVARTRSGGLVRARDLQADSAMAVLLKDAMQPNLVQTLEGNPALVHGGPFANIAHGCNSVAATKLALKLADYVVTEAGFGADLGAEKFFDIKCRKAGLVPKAAVIVATVRALKMHGGVAKDDLDRENLAGLDAGFANLARHIENVGKFGVKSVVAVNRFSADTEAEYRLIRDKCAAIGVEAILCTHWADGGAGAEKLAHAVVKLVADNLSAYAPLYADEIPLWDKIRMIAQDIYGASDIEADQAVRDQIADYQRSGFGAFPVCMAKTPYSFSTDATLKGAPSDHMVTIREVRLAGGAEFLIAISGSIMTMPGLPRVPAAQHIRLNEVGLVEGLS